MFTVEMEEDETCITILDNTGQLEDVSALLYDNFCHIRQWNERKECFDVVSFTPEMYLKLMKAWEAPIGAYDIVLKD